MTFKLKLSSLTEKSEVEKKVNTRVFIHGQDFYDRVRIRAKILVKWLKTRKNWQKIAKVLTVLFLKYLLEYDGLEKWWRSSPFRDILTVLYEGRIASLSLDAKGESAGEVMWSVSPLLSLPVDPMANPEPEKLEWHFYKLFDYLVVRSHNTRKEEGYGNKKNQVE